MRRVAILALALCGCAVPPAPGPVTVARPARPHFDESDLAGAVPADVALALEVDLVRLRASAWSRPVLDTVSPAERASRAALIGYDEIDDADRMLIASGPGGTSLTIVQGRFSRDKVVGAFVARHPGAADEIREELRVLKAADAALAFLTDRTFVSGSPEIVLAAVDCAFGRRPDVRGGSHLGALRRELSGGGQPALRIYGLVTDDMRRQAGSELPIPAELGELGVRADLGDSLSVYGLGILTDHRAAAQMARQLRGVLRGLRLRGLAMLLGLGSVVNQVQIASQGSRVVLRLDLPPEKREELAQGLAAAAAMMRSAQGEQR